MARFIFPAWPLPTETTMGILRNCLVGACLYTHSVGCRGGSISCVAVVLRPLTLASLQCRDGARRVFTVECGGGKHKANSEGRNSGGGGVGTAYCWHDKQGRQTTRTAGSHRRSYRTAPRERLRAALLGYISLFHILKTSRLPTPPTLVIYR